MAEQLRCSALSGDSINAADPILRCAENQNRSHGSESQD